MSFCRNCGVQLLEDWAYCNKCGVSVNENAHNTNRTIPKKELSTFKIVVITVLGVFACMIIKVILRVLFLF